MGRTVINETENKQTVILNDSPEGVNGGYFDEEMVWHDFGGGTATIKSSPLKSPEASLSFTDIEYFSINGNHYEIKQSASNEIFLTLDNIYRNNNPRSSVNQQNLRKIFAFKSGSVVKVKVSNAVCDSGWGIFLNLSNSTAGATELISLERNEVEKEKEKETTITNDIEFYSIYAYVNSGYNLLSFDLELYIDGEQYI